LIPGRNYLKRIYEGIRPSSRFLAVPLIPRQGARFIF
jgi:hypothetical protein